jgi:hypothetical protein
VIRVGLWARATPLRFGTDGTRLLYRKGGVVAFFDLAIRDRPFRDDTPDTWVAPPQLAAVAKTLNVPASRNFLELFALLTQQKKT